MHTVEIVLLLLMLGAVSGLAARYLAAIPLPLLQIALGAALSWPDAGLHVRFDPELFLLLFIPPLLFVDDCTSVEVQKWTCKISYKSMV